MINTPRAVRPALLDLQTIEVDLDGEVFILCNRVVIPEKVRMSRGDELVVTEWDLAGSLTPELELGSALIDWTLRPSINREAIKALRVGYVDAAGHWPALELGSFATAVTGHLNWTYDRICASINSPDREYAEYSESARPPTSSANRCPARRWSNYSRQPTRAGDRQNAQAG